MSTLKEMFSFPVHSSLGSPTSTQRELYGNCSYTCLVVTDQQRKHLFIYFVYGNPLKRRPHATVHDHGRRQRAKWPDVGWGGWGYVTKHLASSFQRHMDLHKHILLCVCRFQTHCLTQSPRLSCNGLEWAQMRGRNLNYWDTPPLQTYTFTWGNFGWVFALKRFSFLFFRIKQETWQSLILIKWVCL